MERSALYSEFQMLAGKVEGGVITYFFLHSNSSIRLPDGSSRSLARPAPASLISPLHLTPPVFNRPMRPSMSFVIIMNRFQPPGSGSPPAAPPLPAPGALK